MNTRYERRSHEAPMDFEWTNKDRDVIPMDSPWRAPAKRSHTDMATPNPSFPEPNPSTPTFGANRNVPFMFHQPPTNSTPSHAWHPHSSLNDVTMRDASPPKPEDPSPSTSPSVRAVATGAMSRVFRARQKQKERSRGPGVRRRRMDPDDDDYEETDDEEDEDENDRVGELVSTPRRRRGLQKSYSDPVTTTANHNHHYTLHMPTPRLSHSEIPYMLLGYLQFFFNLSLVLGFLYLTFHFLRAVQKDVEYKMTESSLESLQEIKACATMYTNNCDSPPPVLVNQCHEWKACMERDASLVVRTRLLAELIGEVINGFMEPITWRTLIFTVTSLAMGIVFVNTLLMFYRARHAPTDNQPAPPPTPAPSFPMYGGQSAPPYWGQTPTPSIPFMFHNPDVGSEMRRTWSAPPIEGDDVLETPSRRRRITEDDVVKVR